MIFQDERRKNVVLGAIAALGALWLYWTFIVAPLRENAGTLDRKIEKGTAELKEVSASAAEYLKKSGAAPKLADARKSGMTLQAETQKIAAETGADKYLKRISPAPARSRDAREELSLTVADIPLGVFVAFLQKLHESPSAINVARASVRAGFENRDHLTAELVLAPAR